MNFGYGAVSGYPGKSTDIGKMGVPAFVEGTWRKGWDGDVHEYFSISALINSQLAEEKIKALNNYYENFDRKYGVMQVIVENDRVLVFYTRKCHEPFDDCTPKPDSDPNNWVTRSPTDSTDVVVLFDGKGERTAKPDTN